MDPGLVAGATRRTVASGAVKRAAGSDVLRASRARSGRTVKDAARRHPSAKYRPGVRPSARRNMAMKALWLA